MFLRGVILRTSTNGRPRAAQRKYLRPDYGMVSGSHCTRCRRTISQVPPGNTTSRCPARNASRASPYASRNALRIAASFALIGGFCAEYDGRRANISSLRFGRSRNTRCFAALIPSTRRLKRHRLRSKSTSRFATVVRSSARSSSSDNVGRIGGRSMTNIALVGVVHRPAYEALPARRDAERPACRAWPDHNPRVGRRTSTASPYSMLADETPRHLLACVTTNAATGLSCV